MTAKTFTGNREEWLTLAASAIATRYATSFEKHFGAPGASRLNNLLVSTGFPSTGGLSKVIGQCWKAETSGDGEHHHIFINPKLSDVVVVIATLAHEMVHAADDCEHQHRGPFLRAVRDIGLEGAATATVAGEEFASFAKEVEKDLGSYPHVELKPMSQRKKQTTRMLKLKCPCCGYVVRTTQKWLDEGYPSCPSGTEMEEA